MTQRTKNLIIGLVVGWLFACISYLDTSNVVNTWVAFLLHAIASGYIVYRIYLAQLKS